MNTQHLRLRVAPMIVLAGTMIAASLIAASPAAAAKGHVSVSVFCFGSQPRVTPGYPLNCHASVFGTPDRPAPTGTLVFSAASYKGTLSANTCTFLPSCPATYTPTGKGSNYRTDTITARYSGDSNYYGTSGRFKVSVFASPPIGLSLFCQDTVQTGQTAFCNLSIQTNGPTQGGRVTLKVATYKGTVGPPDCPTFFSSCPVFYTPKGRGYDSRVDKVTAAYAGDLYNSPAKVIETIRVTAAP